MQQDPQTNIPADGSESRQKNQLVREVAEKKYEYGFTTDVHTEIIERGLNEDVVRLISAKRKSRNGFLSSGSKPTDTGSRSSSPHGPMSTCRR